MSAADTAERWEDLARSAARARAADASPEQLRQLLSFDLSGSPYALPVERVREIVRLRTVTPVPRVPPHVLGVISLRGEIVQVIDLRVRLGLAAERPGPRARILVVHGEDDRIGGLLVDAVTEVLSVSEESLVAPGGESGAVDALCTHGERFVSVIDLDRVWRLDADH